jgi:ketosteroid isomerase-like protein
MTRTTLAPVLLLLAALACRPAAATLPVDGEAAVIEAIAAEFDTVSAIVMRQDWDALAPRLAGDAVVTMDGVATVGRDAILARFRADSSVRAFLDHTFQGTRITPLGPDAAIHTTSFRERLALRTGDTVEVAGTWTNVFRRADDRWRIVHMTSGHVPAAGE